MKQVLFTPANRNPGKPRDCFGRAISVGDRIAFGYSTMMSPGLLAVGEVVEYIRYKKDRSKRMDAIIKVQDEVNNEIRGINAISARLTAVITAKGRT